jgi:hypothetical protein
MTLPGMTPALLALCLLAACGADGEPVAPAADVTLSGDVRVGVTTK